MLKKKLKLEETGSSCGRDSGAASEKVPGGSAYDGALYTSAAAVAAIASFQRKRNGFRNGENSALSPHGRVHSVTTTTRTHAAAAAAAFKGQEEE